MRYTPTELKHLIPLDQYMLANGFEFDKKESTQNWKVLHNPVNQCKYLVRKTQSDWIYKNTQEDTRFKNIFDFVREHNQNVISFSGNENEKNYQIITLLHEYFEPGFQNKLKDNQAIKTLQKSTAKKKLLSSLSDYNKKPIYDFTYLNKQRLISLETINHPLVKNTLFNTHFQFSSGRIAINTGFAKYDKNDTIKGLEVYYETENESKSIVVDKHHYLWHSKITPGKKITGVFFAESGKDALSYFEFLLKNHKRLKNDDPTSNKEFNPLLISINGNLDAEGLKEKQIELIFDREDLLIDNQTRFYSISDNDHAGAKYDLHFLALSVSKLFNEQHKVNSNENPNFQIYKMPFSDSNFEKWNKISHKINNMISENKLSGNSNFGKYFIVKKNKENNTLELFIPKSKDLNYQETFINAFKNIHFENVFGFRTHKPNLKELNGDLDWNAYLMYRKNPSYFLNRQQRHLSHKLKSKIKRTVANSTKKKSDINTTQEIIKKENSKKNNDIEISF